MRRLYTKDKEGNKMKTMKILAITLALALAGCSTTSVVYDDVYYSRRGNAAQQATVAQSTQTYTATAVSTNADFDYQSYYQEGVSSPVYETSTPSYTKTETVVEPDGTTFTTTETYFDSEYESRFRRFHSGTNNFGYYDSYNAGCFDCSRTSFSMGFGYPFGMGYSMSYGYGWGGYGFYDPFWGDPWYGYYGWRRPGWRHGWGWGGYGGYWSGYNHGYWNGYWHGYHDGSYGGWYGDARPGRRNTYYGPRGTYGGGTTVPGTSARGERAGTTEVGSPRGTRTTDVANSNESGVSTRGTAVGTRPEQSREQTAITRGERPQTQTRDRIDRPAERQQESRPAASERINEARQRYERPGAAPSQQQAREQRYQRPQNYTAPNVRQPKSSNEYVRPQAVEQNRQSQPQRSPSNVRQSAPAPRQQSASPAPQRSQPAQSSPNVRSQPTQTRQSSPAMSSPSRSSTPAVSTPSRSSSSSSGSSGSSRGSSSSSDRGGRR